MQSDEVIQVLAKLGVAFLLFLAGLEIDFRLLRGRPLRLATLGFVARSRPARSILRRNAPEDVPEVIEPAGEE